MYTYIYTYTYTGCSSKIRNGSGCFPLFQHRVSKLKAHLRKKTPLPDILGWLWFKFTTFFLVPHFLGTHPTCSRKRLAAGAV